MLSEYQKQRQDDLERMRKAREPKPKKVYKGIPRQSKKKVAELAAEKERLAAGIKSDAYRGKELQEMWFMRIAMKHFTEFGGHCDECGAYIQAEYSKHATAHLLPKKLFRSVACHDLNYLILGAGCGCHEKTHRIDKFVTMKVWPEAARRIKEMIPLLPFDELKHLSSQLLIALDNTH